MKNKFQYLFLSFFVLSSLLSCNKNKETNTTISVAEFAKKIKEDKNVIILDVRTSQEYGQEHLPNAILENMQEDSFNENIAKMDKNKTYMLYCKIGKRSKNALEKMKNAGFKQVFHLAGGLVDWKKAGEKTTK